MRRSVIFSVLMCCLSSGAEPVWHCSRNTSESDRVSSTDQLQDTPFSIASFNSTTDVIGVSINDLIDIYSGFPVRVGGIPLSACFMPADQALTTSALTSLGLRTTVIQALARKSSIVQSNLFPVANKEQMLTCIAQHYPAVGYLNTPTSTDEVHPCF